MLSVWARSNLPMAPAASLRRVALWVQRVASTPPGPAEDCPQLAPGRADRGCPGCGALRSMQNRETGFDQLKSKSRFTLNRSNLQQRFSQWIWRRRRVSWRWLPRRWFPWWRFPWWWWWLAWRWLAWTRDRSRRGLGSCRRVWSLRRIRLWLSRELRLRRRRWLLRQPPSGMDKLWLARPAGPDLRLLIGK